LTLSAYYFGLFNKTYVFCPVHLCDINISS
jgi:hypothetical protein